MIIVWFCWRKFKMSTKFLFCLLLIVVPNWFFTQDILEKNKNWIKYSKVTIHNNDKKKSKVYYLEKGKPVLIQFFENDSIVSTAEIKNAPVIKEKDTINNTYSSDGLLLRDKDITYFYNDKKQLSAKLAFLSTFKITYQYNKKGLISKQFEKNFNGSLGYLTGSMNSFKYDKCNNIIEEKKKSIRLKNKETTLENYDFKDAVVLNYQYVYNKDCLWTRKYFVDKEGKKTLMSKRLIE